MDEQTITSVAQQNSLVIANAVAVGVGVFTRIAGNDVANTINGESVTTERLAMLFCGEFSRNIAARAKAGV